MCFSRRCRKPGCLRPGYENPPGGVARFPSARPTGLFRESLTEPEVLRGTHEEAAAPRGCVGREGPWSASPCTEDERTSRSACLMSARSGEGFLGRRKAPE